MGCLCGGGGRGAVRRDDALMAGAAGKLPLGPPFAIVAKKQPTKRNSRKGVCFVRRAKLGLVAEAVACRLYALPGVCPSMA